MDDYCLMKESSLIELADIIRSKCGTVDDIKTLIGTPAGLTGFNNLLTIPEGVTEIRNNAFEGCKDIKITRLPSTLVHISNHAFSGCENVTIKEIPKSVWDINEHSFDNCNGITELTILNENIYIDMTAFLSCDNLRVIRVPWSYGESNPYAPWGAQNATVVYNYSKE